MGGVHLALALCAGNFAVFAVKFVWLFLPHLRHIGGLPVLLVWLFPLPEVCLCSDSTPLFGTMLLPGGVDLVRGFVMSAHCQDSVLEQAEAEVVAVVEADFQML